MDESNDGIYKFELTTLNGRIVTLLKETNFIPCSVCNHAGSCVRSRNEAFLETRFYCDGCFFEYSGHIEPNYGAEWLI